MLNLNDGCNIHLPVNVEIQTRFPHVLATLKVEMWGEIFKFESFINFVNFVKYFKTPFLKFCILTITHQ